MTKKDLVRAFTAHLEEELATLTAAAKATLEAATHEEAKPENEYDTRGLEASYLAGAQAKRAGELDEILSLFQHLPCRDFAEGEAISATALVEVQPLAERNPKKSFVFLMPKGGGFSLQFEGAAVQ